MDELESLKIESNKLQEEVNIIFNKKVIIDDKIVKLKIELIRDQGLLKNSTWGYRDNRIELRKLSFDKSNLDKIYKILNCDYHDSYNYEFFTLHISDGDIIIGFDQTEDLIKIINFFSIKLDKTYYEMQRTKLIESVAYIDKIIETIDNISK